MHTFADEIMAFTKPTDNNTYLNTTSYKLANNQYFITDLFSFTEADQVIYIIRKTSNIVLKTLLYEVLTERIRCEDVNLCKTW